VLEHSNSFCRLLCPPSCSAAIYAWPSWFQGVILALPSARSCHEAGGRLLGIEPGWWSPAGQNAPVYFKPLERMSECVGVFLPGRLPDSILVLLRGLCLLPGKSCHPTCGRAGLVLCALCKRGGSSAWGGKRNLHCELVFCGEVGGSVKVCSRSEGVICRLGTASDRCDVESWACLGMNLEPFLEARDIKDLMCNERLSSPKHHFPAQNPGIFACTLGHCVVGRRATLCSVFPMFQSTLC